MSTESDSNLRSSEDELKEVSRSSSPQHSPAKEDAWTEEVSASEKRTALSKSQGTQTSLAGHAKGYCAQTSVHGFAYLATARNWCEGVFWFGLIIAGLTFAGINIDKAFL